MKSPLNDIAKTIPVLDVKVVSDIAVDVVPIIVEVCCIYMILIQCLSF